MEKEFLFSLYAEHFPVNSDKQDSCLKLILERIYSVFSDWSQLSTEIRSKMVLSTFRSFITVFVPNLKYSTLQCAKEWNGLVQYHCPVIHRRVFLMLPPSSQFLPVCFISRVFKCISLIISI